ncbi:MAG: hypothetical protein HYS13_08395 [Planctomycetia bacterium]|nr:hypothetical protein [Planctomycetia bacterium]
MAFLPWDWTWTFWATALGVIVALCALVPYILLPLFIRSTFRQPAQPQLVAFDPNHPQLPAEVVGHFVRVRQALEPSGFETVAGLFLPGPLPNVRAVILLLVNRAAGDAAIATAIYADELEGTRLQAAYVEFVTRFRDRTFVQTNNSPEISSFADKRDKGTTVQFPMVADAGRLYRLHRALADRHAGGSGRTLPLYEQFNGDAVAYMTSAITDELEDASSMGYLYRTGDGTYRATWGGAFRMTWKELWPQKPLRRRRRQRKAEQLLAEIEGHGRQPSRLS